MDNEDDPEMDAAKVAKVAGAWGSAGAVEVGVAAVAAAVVKVHNRAKEVKSLSNDVHRLEGAMEKMGIDVQYKTLTDVQKLK